MWLLLVLRTDHILTAFLQQTETLSLSPRPNSYLRNATLNSSTKASFSTARWVVLNVQRSLPKRARGLFSSVTAKSLQSCPTLCDPIDGSPPGCPVPGILQARTLEWVAISFSNAWKWKVKVKSLQSCPTLCDPMDCSLPGSSSMGFSRQEYWSGLPLSSLKCIAVPSKTGPGLVQFPRTVYLSIKSPFPESINRHPEASYLCGVCKIRQLCRKDTNCPALQRWRRWKNPAGPFIRSAPCSLDIMGWGWNKGMLVRSFR